MRRRAIGIVVLAAALALGGCVSANDVADMIVTAPNQRPDQHSRSLWIEIASPFYTDQFRLQVGPPPAALAVAVVEPRNYGFSASTTWKENPESLNLYWQIQANPGDQNTSPAEDQVRNATDEEARQVIHRLFEEAIPKLTVCRPTGTVILLPGWGQTKETLLGYALDFANHGYRVLLVDLRGQGQSSGNYVTYGLIEHRDISQLISALYQRNLVVGKLALVGFSAGATIALDTAGADKRINAVVAVAPFVDLKTAIRGVANVFMPDKSKALTEEELARALAIADRRIGMNLADANPTAHVGSIEAPVLYIAGGKDQIARAADVKALADITPNSRFLEFPRHPHIGLYFGVADVAAPALAALSKTMGPSPDPTCLAAPPPKDVHYTFPFTSTLVNSTRPNHTASTQ